MHQRELKLSHKPPPISYRYMRVYWCFDHYFAIIPKHCSKVHLLSTLNLQKSVGWIGIHHRLKIWLLTSHSVERALLDFDITHQASNFHHRAAKQASLCEGLRVSINCNWIVLNWTWLLWDWTDSKPHLEHTEVCNFIGQRRLFLKSWGEIIGLGQIRKKNTLVTTSKCPRNM